VCMYMRKKEKKRKKRKKERLTTRLNARM